MKILARVIAYSIIAIAAAAVLFSPTTKTAAQFGEGGTIVATCGTLPLAYPVGATRSLTMDTTGKICQ